MNIDEMPAGRALDALIAEKVMGWNLDEVAHKEFVGHRRRNAGIGMTGWEEYDEEQYRTRMLQLTIPPFSFDKAAVWQVVEYILTHDKRLLQFRTEIAGGGKHHYAKFVDCGDNSAPVYGVRAASMPLAICCAALKVARSSQ